MSVYNPPTENVPIFDTTLFTIANDGIGDADTILINNSITNTDYQIPFVVNTGQQRVYIDNANLTFNPSTHYLNISGGGTISSPNSYFNNINTRNTTGGDLKITGTNTTGVSGGSHILINSILGNVKIQNNTIDIATISNSGITINQGNLIGNVIGNISGTSGATNNLVTNGQPIGSLVIAFGYYNSYLGQGSAGQVLTSAGAGSVPVFATPSVSNINGGTASAMPYQSSAGTTAFTSGTNVVGLVMGTNSSGIPDWQYNFGVSLGTSIYTTSQNITSSYYKKIILFTGNAGNCDANLQMAGNSDSDSVTIVNKSSFIVRINAGTSATLIRTLASNAGTQNSFGATLIWSSVAGAWICVNP